MAELVPWDERAEVHAKHLDTGAGRESVDFRMVIGAFFINANRSSRVAKMIIKEMVQE